MSRNFHFLPLQLALAAGLFTYGCQKSNQNQEAVKQAIVEHLSKRTDNMLAAMDVEVKNVSFRTDGADAAVSFRPKGSKDGGLDMNYELELKNGKWAVKPKPAMQSDPHGGGAASPNGGGAPTGGMPAGHPPLPSQPVHPKN